MNGWSEVSNARVLPPAEVAEEFFADDGVLREFLNSRRFKALSGLEVLVDLEIFDSQERLRLRSLRDSHRIYEA
jgi:hypothetical protein